MRCDKFFVVKPFDTDKRVHRIIGVNVEQVLYSSALAVFGTFGYLIYLEPVAPALAGEEQHVVVHRRGVDVLDKVFVAGIAAARAHTATVLRSEFRQRSTLDVAEMTYCNNHIVVGIEILRVEVAGGVVNRCHAGIAVFVTHLGKFALYKLTTH